MRTSKRITESPWKEICDEEWDRASGIIRFSRNKPSFIWRKKLGGRAHGRCSRFNNQVSVLMKYLYTNCERAREEFRLMLRHEFAHFISHGHGMEFRLQCLRLGGTRYINMDNWELADYPKKEKKEIVKEKSDLKEIRYQQALLKVKEFEMKFKRSKTLLKKWQRKVKYYEAKKNSS